MTDDGEATHASRPESKVLRALVVEQWPLLRQGIASALQSLPSTLTDEASTSADALYALRSQVVNILIVGSTPDMSIADTVLRAKQLDQRIRVVALVPLAVDGSLRAVASAGADAILTRVATSDELIEAIRRVRDGGHFISTAALPGLVGEDTGAARNHEGLTPKEREVVALLVAGRTNQQIADALFVTAQTVKSHLSHIYAKLGVTNRREAVQKAIEADLAH